MQGSRPLWLRTSRPSGGDPKRCHEPESSLVTGSSQRPQCDSRVRQQRTSVSRRRSRTRWWLSSGPGWQRLESVDMLNELLEQRSYKGAIERLMFEPVANCWRATSTRTGCRSLCLPMAAYLIGASASRAPPYSQCPALAASARHPGAVAAPPHPPVSTAAKECVAPALPNPPRPRKENVRQLPQLASHLMQVPPLLDHHRHCLKHELSKQHPPPTHILPLSPISWPILLSTELGRSSCRLMLVQDTRSGRHSMPYEEDSHFHRRQPGKSRRSRCCWPRGSNTSLKVMPFSVPT